MTGDDYRAARKHARLTLRAAADKIGMSFQSVQQWEKGISVPKPEHVEAMSRAYGVELTLPDPLPTEHGEWNAPPQILELISAANAVVQISYRIQFAETRARAAVEILARSVGSACDVLPPEAFQKIAASSSAIVHRVLESGQGVSAPKKRSTSP